MYRKSIIDMKHIYERNVEMRAELGSLAASARICTVAPRPRSRSHLVSCRINGLRALHAQCGRGARLLPGLLCGRHPTTTSGRGGLSWVDGYRVVVSENA